MSKFKKGQFIKPGPSTLSYCQNLYHWQKWLDDSDYFLVQSYKPQWLGVSGHREDGSVVLPQREHGLVRLNPGVYDWAIGDWYDTPDDSKNNSWWVLDESYKDGLNFLEYSTEDFWNARL